ncbi:flagellar type III secretion system pore protein FliP [Alienimonas californiensis]|uniref:Flagellar biosynthetic protein FliP n=1 Tax=Alienimonas californiensis TaxID=2527989 RepID=A0A517PE27_9PLAN|nr:flagellar type III secretion system pore protein FliP [Alienimonas californiensis]QDT17627.1 Flagellar biosynthetic protein FliP precursor [Alienimonas californiensis]
MRQSPSVPFSSTLRVAAALCGLLCAAPASAQGIVRQNPAPTDLREMFAPLPSSTADAGGFPPLVVPAAAWTPEAAPIPPLGPAAPAPGSDALTLPEALNPDTALSPGGLTNTLKILGLLTVLSLAPSILLMTTCFVRFVIVIGLLKQAIGTQQMPPNQVVVSLCLFLTVAVMGPVWGRCYDEGIRPYTDPAPGEVPPTLDEAFDRTAAPLRAFMADQIERTGNGAAVRLFLDYRRPADASPGEGDPETYDEVPLGVLIPAYMLSELKTAFVIGFQIYLPFLVIDLVVSAVLISMGMMMLPPVLISLPFKLLLFVLVDGWFLTVGMLMEGVRPL